MKVLVGATFSIDMSSPPPTAAYAVSPQEELGVVASCLFLKDGKDGGEGEETLISSRIGPGNPIVRTEDSSESSSSIGAPDDSEEDEGEEEKVVSSKGAFSSLDSLEESLPIKRGLSNYFCGKSKSFANLSDMSSMSTAKDLEKPDNPFNKRRRILMANKWSRRSSFYSWSNPKSMPVLTLNESDHEDNQERDEEQSPSSSSVSSTSEYPKQHKKGIQPKLQEGRFKTSFKSQSCFSLADLQEQEQDQDQDQEQ